MYSTWFSVAPRGYCDRIFLGARGSGLRDCVADSDECCDSGPIDSVLDFELGSDVRSESAKGGWGDLEGRRECCDMSEADREEGKLAKEVRRFALEPLAWPFGFCARDMEAKDVALAMAGESQGVVDRAAVLGRWDLSLPHRD